MYVTLPTSSYQADIRPLPVEKSAGKVSSLVARWQTAANKAEESAARQRDSDSRRSSTVSQASASASRRSSENYSAKPSPRVENGAFPRTEEDGIEELRDLDIDDSKKVRGDDVEQPGGLEGSGSEEGHSKDVRAGKRAEIAAPAPKVADQPGKPIPRSPITKKSTGRMDADTPKAKIATSPTTTKAAAPQSPKALSVKAPTPSKIPTATAGVGKQPSSTSSDRTRTTSGSSRIPQAVKPKVSSTPSQPRSSQETTGSAVAAKTPSASKISTPAKTPAPVKAATPATTSVPRLSTAQKTPLSSAAKVPRPAPSSFSRGTASKLTPSHTGPMKRPSSTTPGSSSISPTPLRPQITGTPSKPTASSLAKAKEASEKRKSLTMGRTSGQARQSFSGTRSGIEVPKSTPPSAMREKTVMSSGSRLMQGTASSRAKAAAAQPASPTRSKTVKPATSTPVKSSASKVGDTPVKSAKKTNATAGATTQGIKGAPKSAEASNVSSITAPRPMEADTAQSVVPRTPSPRPRSAVEDENKNVEQEPDSDEQDEGTARSVEAADVGNEEVSHETPRAAIIGRVGLAGAREAPKALEGSEDTARAEIIPDSAKAPFVQANGDHNKAASEDAPQTFETIEDVDEALIARLHPGDIDASGHIADPEMPRSAPSPEQNTTPSRNLFGRIGHPGAGTKTHELESPNLKTDSESTAEQKEAALKKTEWNEEELKRDPAKTIVSPDTGKGAFAEEK